MYRLRNSSYEDIRYESRNANFSHIDEHLARWQEGRRAYLRKRIVKLDSKTPPHGDDLIPPIKRLYTCPSVLALDVQILPFMFPTPTNTLTKVLTRLN
jgi:hypothetical protein